MEIFIKIADIITCIISIIHCFICVHCINQNDFSKMKNYLPLFIVNYFVFIVINVIISQYIFAFLGVLLLLFCVFWKLSDIKSQQKLNDLSNELKQIQKEKQEYLDSLNGKI